MSRLKIKLRLPSEQESPSGNSSPASTSNQVTPAQASTEVADSASAAGAASSTTAASPPQRTIDGLDRLQKARNGPTSASTVADESVAADVSTADASMAAVSDDEEEEGESEDELQSEEEEDGIDPETGRIQSRPSSSSGLAALKDPNLSSLSPSSRRAAINASRQRRNAALAEIEGMTAEQIDALPAAKRRKGAKARGASGPGRGWRKGLKM